MIFIFIFFHQLHERNAKLDSFRAIVAGESRLSNRLAFSRKADILGGSIAIDEDEHMKNSKGFSNEELVDQLPRLRSTVVGYLSRHGSRNSAADAGDILQETASRAMEHRDQFNGGNLASWLMSIAFNLMRDTFRKSGYGLTCSIDADDSTAAHTARETSPEETCFAHERAAFVKKAIDSLPPGDKAAASLHVWHDMSCKEIMEALGISEKALKARLWRAYEALAKLLAPVATKTPKKRAVLI